MADPHDIGHSVRHFQALAALRRNHQSRITDPPVNSRLHNLRNQPQLWPVQPPVSSPSASQSPPPQDPQSLRFHNMLVSLAAMPTRWENQALLDQAITMIPLQTIHDEAEEESQLFSIEAASLASTAPMSAPISDFIPKWAYQDCLIRSLLRWFRQHFFSWVNNPTCTKCHSPTVGVGMAAPSPDEIAYGAVQVELYRCADPNNSTCGTFVRFPRYSDPSVLLRTRQGRVGEWANCFGLLCRALGARVRWVWNSEDHVWIEVFSSHRNRWVHVDACEQAWDKPKLYTGGWRRKLAYCIAFSADGGASDVTRRYVRDPLTQALPRDRVDESVLANTIQHIRFLRRANLTTIQADRIEAEDRAEEKELSSFFFLAMMPAVLDFLKTVTFPSGTELPRLQAHSLSRAQQQSIRSYRAMARLSAQRQQLQQLQQARPQPQRQQIYIPRSTIPPSFFPNPRSVLTGVNSAAPSTNSINGSVQTGLNSITSTIMNQSSDLVDVQGEINQKQRILRRRGRAGDSDTDMDMDVDENETEVRRAPTG